MYYLLLYTDYNQPGYLLPSYLDILIFHNLHVNMYIDKYSANCVICKIPAVHHFCGGYIVFWKNIAYSVVIGITFPVADDSID